MGWPVTELYRDVKSPWARQRNPIWRPLLGGDNSASAGSSGDRPCVLPCALGTIVLSCSACSAPCGLLERGEYRFRTSPRSPPPTTTTNHVYRVFSIVRIYKTRKSWVPTRYTRDDLRNRNLRPS